MEDIREIQRQKWLKSQEARAAAVSVGSADSSASVSSTAAVVSHDTPHRSVSSGASSSSERVSTEVVALANAKPHLRRVHILPVGPFAEDRGGHRLQMLAPELKRLRDRQVVLRQREYIMSGGSQFVIVKSEPEEGLLFPETDYYVEGDPIVHFEKVQFVCLLDFQSDDGESLDSGRLFREYVSPYFRSLVDSGDGLANILSVGETFNIFGRDFRLLAAEPNSAEIGLIDNETIIYVDRDGISPFERVHIIPFQDTLPNAYSFDIFNDYLKPYISRNKYKSYEVNEQFTYQGVQFKVVCVDPEGPGRIGRNTTIYCEGTLHPSLRNLLPPELVEQLSHLPAGLQMLLLNTDTLAGRYQDRLMEVQDMLSRRRGLNPEAIDRVEKFNWNEGGHAEGDQTQCMVCLMNFEGGEEVRRLPCHHLFHANCIDEWLRRCTDCPVCRVNIDQAVRRV